MMTAVKQSINSLIMYVYLIYYTERLRRDRRFMMLEAVKGLKESRINTLKKIAQYEEDFNWRR